MNKIYGGRYAPGILLCAIVSATAVFSGCLSQSSTNHNLEVNPIIDYYPLGGFAEKSNELFIVQKGTAQDVRISLSDIVLNKSSLPSAFSVDDELNIVVFRGVFNTGGYGIRIERVERKGNEFVVYAIYTDPGKGLMTIQVFTQPTAIIPVGKLEKGDYKATLKVTLIIENKEGKKIIETEKELMNFEFKIK
jgi:hypothetical protein